MDLKPLSKEAIPAALAKAERYRLLNEPADAESICLDVLRVDPTNQDAVVTLLLALSDQFEDASASHAVGAVHDVIARLRSEYDRHYYSGIVCERRGKAWLHRGRPAQEVAAWLREALGHYELAEALRETGNDDAILRWNACVRILTSLPVHTEVGEPEPLQLE